MSDKGVLTPAQMVIRELERFLGTDKPEVLCIRGRWGFGKTYAWAQALQNAKKKHALKLNAYAYVSLFGVSSIEHLKHAIFENTTYGDAIGIEPSLETLTENWGSVLGSATKRMASKVLQALPLFKNSVSALQAASFVTVRKQIVCIDDLERKGASLRLIDVLGLVSMLREHRDCKVVLILNDEQLAAEKEELEKYQEKVIDTSLVFAPTAQESSDIALQNNNEFGNALKSHCIKLDIANIRIIKKIEAAIWKVQPVLKGYDEYLFRRAIHSIALLAWAHYSETERQLEHKLTDFILKKHGRGLHGTNHKLSEDEKRWEALLNFYGFTSADEFDVLLCEGIQHGYFDEHHIRQQANAIEQQLRASEANEAWSKAWETYRNSFDHNLNEWIAQLKAAFEKFVDHMTARNLYNAMLVLKVLGRNREAREMLHTFMERRQESAEFFDLDKRMFDREIEDPEIRRAFAARLSSLQRLPEPHEILLDIYHNNSWQPIQIKRLAELSVDDYYNIFKMPLGEDLPRIVQAALGFNKFHDPEADYLKIAATATEALRKIAKESPLNVLRVQNYGVVIEPDQSDERTSG